MKSKFTPIYTSFSLLLILFLFLGYSDNSSPPDNSNNPPNGRTGAPGDYGLCTSCHSPGNPQGFDGEVIIENFPSDISPNTNYSITVRVTNPNELAFRAGFQAVVLDESDNNSGDLSVSGSNPTTSFEGPLNREYVEHNPAINFGGGSEVTWDFTWTSPNGPTGEVITMYAAGNIASGGNGNQQDLIVTSNVSGTMIAGGDPLEVQIISFENVSCFGGNDGSATASASGGTSPYSYSWSSGSNMATANNLSAGTYTVTVTDDVNATATAMVTITEPSELVVTIISQTNIDCNNPVGSATAAGSGGTAPYSYNWSSGGTSQTETFSNPGTYSVSVTDSNLCIDITMVTITQDIIPPIANAGADGQLDCNTTVLVLDGTGSSMGAEFTYLWTTFDGNILSGATTLNPSVDAAGTYSLTVTNQNNGCTASDDVVVIEIEGVTLFITGENVSCFGGSDGSINLTVSGGQAPFDYNWDDDAQDGMEDPSGLTAGNYCVTVTDVNDCTATTCIEITEPSEIILSATVTNISCFGLCDGSINLTVNGGSGNNTFMWTGPNGYAATTQNIDALCAGNYDVTVTDDNNCTATLSETIIEPDDISITGSITHVTCNSDCDGSISLSVTGGTGGYSYLWNDSQTTQTAINLCAGDYSATVTDDNGCTAVYNGTVTEPTEISLSATIMDATCNGVCDGSINLSVSGGTSPYTYEWDTNPVQDTMDIMDLCAGDYTVIVTDANSCTNSATYTITEPTALSLTATITDASCNGVCDGSIDLSVSGGTSPYTYEWDTNPVQNTEDIMDLCAGDYTVIVTDANGCSSSTTYTVTEPTPLSVTAATTDVTCNGDCDGGVNITVSGGTSPFTYEWDTNPTQNSEDIDSLCAGTYTVTVTDANGCTELLSATVSEPDALDLQLTSTDETMPGANDGTATAEVTGGTFPYSYLWDDPANQTTATAIDLAPGTYCVMITDDNNCTISACITVNEGGCDLTATVNTTDVSCNDGNDGEAEAITSGGTAPYTYNWSSGGTGSTETGLAIGTYSVTITDASNCEIIVSFTIDGPPALVLDLTSTDESSNGASDGTATANVSGGAPGYTYLWDDPLGQTTAMIENLSPGTYCVTVTDFNGCSITGCVSVNPGDCTLEAEIAVTNVSCNGGNDGSATVTATGGTPPYTYEWSSGGNEESEINLSAGSYMVTIFDSDGCCIILNFEVTEPTQLQVSASTTPVKCNGDCDGSIDLEVSGGTPGYSYDWSNGSTAEDLDMLCAGTYTVTVTDNNGCSVITQATVTEPPPLVLTMSSTDETAEGANDGTASANVTGGTLGYTYLWDDASAQTTATIENLPPGTYCVTITDMNGCTISDCTVVNPFGCSISLEISGVSFTCPDTCEGAIDLTVIGGTEPFTFLWSDGVLGNIEDPAMLCVGTYSVTVTDNDGCSASTSTTVESFPGMSFNFQNIDASCFGSCDGGIDLTVDGGNPPFTYDWSNGDTAEDPIDLCAGNYSVTVTDSNGCTQSSSVFIDEPSELLVAANATDASCFEECDGTVDLIFTGGTPPYSFSGPMDMLCAGTYPITITDVNGCIATASFDINEPDEIEITVDDIGNEMNAQSDGFINVTVIGGTTPYTYNWLLSGNTISTDEDPTGLVAGSYTLEIIDANGCVIALQDILVDNIVGLVNRNLKNYIDVFPNPTSGSFQIEFDLMENEFVEIEVFDFTGKKVLETSERNVLNQRLAIDLNPFAEGVYTLKINVGDAFLIERIVKHD